MDVCYVYILFFFHFLSFTSRCLGQGCGQRQRNSSRGHKGTVMVGGGRGGAPGDSRGRFLVGIGIRGRKLKGGCFVVLVS